MLCSGSAQCSFTGKQVVIDWVQEFGGGFSCKQLSKANNRRTSHKNCIADETGTTGGTWAGIRDYILLARPAVAFLENVTELMNECEVPNPKEGDHGETFGAAGTAPFLPTRMPPLPMRMPPAPSCP